MPSLRRAVLQRQRKLAETAAETLRMEHGEVDEKVLKGLTAAKAVLAVLGERFTKALAVAVAFFCLIGVTLAWTIRIPRTHVFLSVDTDEINLETSKDWTATTSFPAAKVHLQTLARVEAPGLGLNVNSKSGDAWLTASGGGVRLDRLAVGKATELTVSALRPGVEVFVRHGEVTGTVVIDSGDSVRSGDSIRSVSSQVHRGTVPESIDFVALAQSQVATRILLEPRGTSSFHYISFTRIAFYRERPVGASAGDLTAVMSEAFESSIKSGSIITYDVPNTYVLREGDRVSLRNTTGRILRITPNKEGLRLDLEATAREVLIGPEGAERNMAPSILEYLYHREPISVVWGALAFMWSLLWSSKKVFWP